MIMQTTSGRLAAAIAAVVLAGVLAAAAFVYSGVYDVGADAPHSRAVFWLLQTARERSVAAHSARIAVPDLNDPALILKGAGQYAAMCTGCHLAPGMAHSEIRAGLYPLPPDLAHTRVGPAEAFWVIKHGIKMSAMPAWGGSHDDATIWSMVAFLQKLPTLTPAQYRDIVAKAPPDDDMD
jgi:mono/diheme cytochrome c family protein